MEIYLPRRRVHQQWKYIYGDDEFTNNGNISTTTTILPTIQIYLRDDEFTNNGKIYALRYQEIIQPRDVELTKNENLDLHWNDMLTSYGNVSTGTTC